MKQMVAMVWLASMVVVNLQARQPSTQDINLRSDGMTYFGQAKAKIVKFGGYNTPECKLAIGVNNGLFYLRKMHSTCWKGNNRNGVKIICNSNKSVCKTRSELATFVEGGNSSYSSSGGRYNKNASSNHTSKSNRAGEELAIKAMIGIGKWIFSGGSSSSSASSSTKHSHKGRYITNLGIDAPKYDWDANTVWYKSYVSISNGSHIYARVYRSQGCYSLLVGSVDSSISGNCSNCSDSINGYWSCHANGTGSFSVNGNQVQAANRIVQKSR
jgi:hypothetical protein